MERKPQDQDKYIVRFPAGMRDRIRDEADRNSRSMNAEIIHRLETTLEMDAYDPSENVGEDQVIVRLTPELAEAISKAAERSRRTTEAQALEYLEKAFLTPFRISIK